MSPITIVCVPAFVNAAHAVSPSGGVIRAPPTVAAMSARGIETLNTPSFASSVPFAPVSRSIAAVSSAAAGLSAAAAAPAETTRMKHVADQPMHEVCHAGRSTSRSVAAQYRTRSVRVLSAQ